MSAMSTKVCPTCNTKFDTAAKFCPHDSSVLVDDPEALVGTTLDGQYRIEKLLGKGGMGAVYRARHAVLGDEVAIKLLRAGMESNEMWLRRFQREGKAARRFKHPNAVVVHDLRVAGDGTTYMVLEYVNGPDLRHELKRLGRFEPGALVPILRQLADVLDAGHAAGVVHRDLKPDNVMLAEGHGGRPVVKLLDLGIAKLRETADQTVVPDSVLTVAGQIIGTPHYMSPEQWGELPRDGSREIDGRADVYSLAVMIYELLAGSWPVSGTTIGELRSGHVSGPLARLGDKRPDLPAAVGQVIARGMARDRAERYATAGELVRDLERAFEGAWDGPVASTPEPAVHVPTIAIQADPETAAPRSVAETAVESQPPAPVGGSSLSAAATVVQPVESHSGAAVPHRAEPARSRAGLWAVGALVATVGIGAATVALWPPAPKPDIPPPPPTLPAPVERLSYYLEAVSPRDAKRVSGEEPVAVGYDVSFHFAAPEAGYLYIVGLAPGNVPATFLTAQPSKESGIATNRVEKGIEYTFPGAGQVLELTPETMATPFTVVYSRTPLADPAFFTQESGRVLSTAEQGALEAFVAKYRSSAAKTAKAEPPLVVVSAPEATDPIVFDVTIRQLPKK
jgi:eukaryotic-like serine/threonine-protein kinase